jgi:rSAM/selenodomain-associated transferase 2
MSDGRRETRGEGKKKDALPRSDQAVPTSLFSRPPSPLSSLSIIVPTLNEAAGIVAFLAPLQALRGPGVEIVLADGGSRDGTVVAATPMVDRVVAAPRGRASQMNAGAAVSTGDVLLFLHADCRLPDYADRLILDGFASSRRRWGRFDVKLSGGALMLRIVERAMNLRSRLTGICTGDQGMFVERTLFEQSGGFPDIALMEDLAFSRTLRRFDPPLCLSVSLLTSSRRWEKNGIWRTIVLMWRLRLAYFLGVEPRRLSEIYHGQKK